MPVKSPTEVRSVITLDEYELTITAAAVVLMKRSRALELGQPILAKFCGATIAGVPPRIMGIGMFS